MKKNLLIATVAGMLLASCGGNGASSTAATNEDEHLTFENMETREMDGMTVTWIQDNANERLSPADLFDAPDSIITKLGLTEGIPSTVSCFLVEKDSLHILFDAGLGAPDSQLLPSLDKLGISPDQIDVLVLTHLHGDHIGGMLINDSVTFNNAQVYMAKDEYDAWMGMDDQKSARAKACLNPYQERLHLVQYGDTIPGNFVALEAKGHTPGHTVFQSGDLLVIGDLMHGAALQVAYPQYCPKYDMDKEQATQTRIQYLDMARQNHLLMAGMHLPAPAFLTLE